jgi:hypothetical protein
MRHLKRFNESLDENELLDFCEVNLAYLLDEGFNIMISSIILVEILLKV